MMKAPVSNHGRRGFTLPELTISLALFVMLMGGVVVANLFGLRWFQIIQVKMLASDTARKAIGHLTDEVRTCTSVSVGTVTNGVFVGCANNQLQQGGSLLIYQSTNTTNYILYFFNSADQTFRRVNTAINETTVIAGTLTNGAGIFQEQDYLGNVLSNAQNNSMIHCCLQFYASGTTNPVADFYQLQTCVTPRLLQ